MATAKDPGKSPQPKPTSPPPIYGIQRGHPLPLGATVHRKGVNFAIFSKPATSCTLVLYEPGSERVLREIPLDPHVNRIGQVWHVFVEGLDTGAHYAFRFDMQPNPEPQIDRFFPPAVCSIPTPA